MHERGDLDTERGSPPPPSSAWPPRCRQMVDVTTAQQLHGFSREQGQYGRCSHSWCPPSPSPRQWETRMDKHSKLDHLHDTDCSACTDCPTPRLHHPKGCGHCFAPPEKRNKMVPFPLGTHLFFHLEPRPPQWSGWFRIATQPHPHTSRPCPSQQKWENELYPSQNQDTHAVLVLISIIRKYIRLVCKLGLCVTVVFIVNSTESFLNLFKLGYQWSGVKFKCW